MEDRLRRFAALVEKWSAKINLVSRADIPHIRTRHIEDSLALLPHIAPGTECAIDLGSGAGFPGLVLAIATGIPFTLIESDKRKAAFLMDAARELSAPVKVLAVRIEDAKPPPSPLITARALAPLPQLLGLAWPHLAPGGKSALAHGSRAAASRGGNLYPESEQPSPCWTCRLKPESAGSSPLPTRRAGWAKPPPPSTSPPLWPWAARKCC
jgi:16S rRNA (guanine527-N7)-methyltransferase